MNKKLRTIAAVFLVATAAAIVAPVPPASSSPAAQTAETAPTTQPDLSSPAVETVVIFRHAEKPEDGLGQLTPQGLNRSLALSILLPQKFGKPDYLFAPDPAERSYDAGQFYNYIRPLATIEPTAIRLGMPVQTSWGYRDTDELVDELSKPHYARSVIFVAWEHNYARIAAADLFKKFGGKASDIPSWPSKDFDSLYVITIHRTPGQAPTATFIHDHEGLDGQSKEMPVAAAK